MRGRDSRLGMRRGTRGKPVKNRRDKRRSRADDDGLLDCAGGPGEGRDNLIGVGRAAVAGVITANTSTVAALAAVSPNSTPMTASPATVMPKALPMGVPKTVLSA